MPAERLLAFGIDHHRSSVELRERLAIGAHQLSTALQELHDLPGISEAAILSTCNRTECYCAGSGPSVEILLDWLAERQGCDRVELAQHCYQSQDQDAARHLFRVAASLESLVVGEYQIMNQVRFAYYQGQQAETVGPQLHGLFQAVLFTGKRVRNETSIGQHKLSVSSIALDLASHIHGKLEKCSLLVVGAGEMAELTMRHAIDRGVNTLTIINRSRENAEQLAAEVQSWHGPERSAPAVKVAYWNDLTTTLATHDIVVTSTASNVAVITAESVRQAMLKRRNPLMLIDLAVPRDVETGVAEIDDVYLYNIDHLDEVVAQNRALRSDEVDSAAQLVDECVGQYWRDCSSSEKDLRQQAASAFGQLAADELARVVQGQDFNTQQMQAVEQAFNRLSKKFSHRLLNVLKQHPGDDKVSAIVDEIVQFQSRR